MSMVCELESGTGQIEAYRERGFFVADTGLSAVELQDLRDAVDGLAEKARQRACPGNADPSTAIPSSRLPRMAAWFSALRGRPLRRPAAAPSSPVLVEDEPENGYLYDVAWKDDTIGRLVRDPRIVDLVAPLMGGERISLFTSKLVFKPPGSRQWVPLHQDYPRNAEAANKPEIWLAIDDADENNGCLRVVPGSHADGAIPHVASKVEYMSLEIENHDAWMARSVPVPVRAGQAVVFNTRIVHGSLASRDNRPRRAFVLAYQDCEDAKPARGEPIIVLERHD